MFIPQRLTDEDKFIREHELMPLRDLLLPGIAGLESKVDGRVQGDLKVDSDGLWLLLAARGRTAKIHMASPGYIESGGYKDTFGIKATTAFDAFDQATRDTGVIAKCFATDLAPGGSQILCEADKASRKITFYVREGFGDGTDGTGQPLANPETAERDAAARVFLEAIDVMTGAGSVVPIERWARMHIKEPVKE